MLHALLQAAGTWLVNEITSSEVEELVKAFQAMTTVVSFANMTLESGDIEVAEMNYIDALKLFTKLENGRGVRGRLFICCCTRALSSLVRPCVSSSLSQFYPVSVLALVWYTNLVTYSLDFLIRLTRSVFLFSV